MLEQIISNPIETPNGVQNPDQGIALRGPLSAFFSGIYLKALDDAFDSTDTHYFRFQDDILILCPTKRSLGRAKLRLMNVLKTKRLALSVKKSKIAPLESGFHFLGINYLGTQTSNNTTTPKSVVDASLRSLFKLSQLAENNACNDTQQPNILTPVPHPRTLRMAREQVNTMLKDGISFRRISSYLQRWTTWWGLQTFDMWTTREMLLAFILLCWDKTVAGFAYGLLPKGR